MVGLPGWTIRASGGSPCVDGGTLRLGSALLRGSVAGDAEGARRRRRRGRGADPARREGGPNRLQHRSEPAGRLSAFRSFHWKSDSDGNFVWAHRALDGPSRAVVIEQRLSLLELLNMFPSSAPPLALVHKNEL
jgi:hypothetical protein